MDSLGDALIRLLPVPGDGEDYHIPDDGVCPGCDRLKRDHPGVERILAMREYKYYDTETHRLKVRESLPYCRCGQPWERSHD